MAFQTSDLPFGSEFSPSQVSLTEVLRFAQRADGDTRRLESQIRERYFSFHSSTGASADRKEYNRAKLANNCRLGMIAYGIVDRESRLTEFGTSLCGLIEDEPRLYEALAKHILLNLKGMTLVQCLRDMVAAGEVVTLDSLRHALAVRGVSFPRGGKHPSMMRLWLAKAGVIVGSRWQVDSYRLNAVLGVTNDDFPALAMLSENQRGFLRALINLGDDKYYPANEIARLAEASFGLRFPDKSLPKSILTPIADAGFIEMEKTTVGRGAKPFLVRLSDHSSRTILEGFLEQLRNQIDPKLVALLRKPLSDIMADVESSDRYVSGLGLEAMAFRVMRSLGLSYLSTRLRAEATGGAEVDLVFHTSQLAYSRWQVQCKNSVSVALDDVAKEVGLTRSLKSNVVVMMTTGSIGAEARRFANKVMMEENLSIIMLDGSDLALIAATPPRVLDVFQREATHAMTLKQIETRGSHS